MAANVSFSVDLGEIWAYCGIRVHQFGFFCCCYVDGVRIVQFQSEFYIPDLTFCGLEVRSMQRCPGHGLIPARRVAWGGASSGRRFLVCPLDVSVWLLSLIRFSLSPLSNLMIDFAAS